MPDTDSVEALAEALADALGIYQQQRQFVGLTVAETRAFIAAHDVYDLAHADTCQCRMCWTGAMERRIRTAVANDHQEP
jgi:hypothetical protein